MILITDAGFIVTTVRDHENQCLPPAFGTGTHHLDGFVIFVLMHLVNQCAVGARARLTIIGTDGPKERAGLQKGQVPFFSCTARRIDTLRQCGRLINHRHCVAKQDHRLVFFRRGRIDLGTRLLVCHQAIQTNPR